MARFARLLERSLVDVVVTRRTTLKLEPDPFGCAVGRGGVALLTIDLQVRAGQRKPCFAMAEGEGFPLHRAMTLEAILSQLPAVLIFMASGARGRQAQERTIQVFCFQFHALGRRDSLGIVAAVAG